MEKNERETVIVINAVDLEQGYFAFGTSERSHFERICKRIGGKHLLLDIKEEKDHDGKVSWWECHIPAHFLSLRTFAIGRKAKRNISQALASRMANGPLKANVGRQH